MQIRFQLLTAAAAVLCVPWSPAGAQTTASAAVPLQTAASPATSSQVVSPSAANTLPQAPSSMLAGQNTGLVQPPGSGVRFVAAGETTGPGGLPIEKATAGPLSLSLDDAVSLALERNARSRFQRANQQLLRGYIGQVTNALIPNLQFRASSSAQEINLLALGFKPSLVSGLPGFAGLTFPSIVKVDTTSVQISLDQTVFNLPEIELYRAVKPEERSVNLTIQDNNEQVVEAVATAYLQVLADQANLNNSVAQEAAAKLLFEQATARDQAGVGIRLDVLRAQVEYQQREQQHVSAEAQLDKDGIQLNRIMGIPAGQELDLTDEAPFSELGDLSFEQARQTAYTRRSDLLALGASLEVAAREIHAARYQRLPTVAVNGFYGILGQDTGIFHGVFTAEGSLRFPIFREAAQRGEEQTAVAQLMTLRAQESSLRGTIDSQIRNSMLDITSSRQLVTVSESNVDLAQQELADARDRFAAGVSDNLEVVDALATVTGAQAQLVSALYQYNTAKVALARGTGVLQTRYRAFLGM